MSICQGIVSSLVKSGKYSDVFTVTKQAVNDKILKLILSYLCWFLMNCDILYIFDVRLYSTEHSGILSYLKVFKLLIILQFAVFSTDRDCFVNLIRVFLMSFVGLLRNQIKNKPTKWKC